MKSDLDAIRSYLAAGHSVYDLARASGVPRSTIQTWLENGVPESVVLWNRVLEALREIP